MKSPLYSLTIASLLAVSPLAPSSSTATPNGKPFVEIQGQIVEVQSDVSALEARYDLLTEKVDGLALDVQGRIDVLSGEIATLQQQDAALASELEQVVYDLEAQGTNIQQLLQSLSEVNLSIVELSNGAEDQSDAIAALRDQQAQILESIASLDAGVVSAFSAISDNQQLIDMLAQDVQDLEASKQNEILDGCPDGMVLQSVLDSGAVVCTSVQNGGTIESSTVSMKVRLINKSKTVTKCAEYFLGVCIATYQETTTHRDKRRVDVQCPAGWTVTGGGYLVEPSANIRVWQSEYGGSATAESYVIGLIYLEERNSDITVRVLARCIRAI